MKYFLLLVFMYSSALGQQLPTGPLQFVRDTKTVNVKQDTVTPGNSVGLPVNIVAGTVNATNPSVSATGAAVPASATFIGANKSGNLVAPTLDASDNLNVNVQSSVLPTGAATEATLSSVDGKIVTVDTGNVTVVSSTLPLGAATDANQTTMISDLGAINATTVLIDGKIIKSDTDNVTVISSALPTGAATETTLSSIDGKITAVDTDDVTVTSSALPTGAATEATLSSVDGKIPANLTVTATRLLVDGSGVTQPVSGTITVSNQGLTDAELRASAVPVSAASLPLPTGASTETTLSALETKVPSGLTVTSTRLLVDPSGVTSPVSIAASVQTKDPVNTGGSYFDASISAVDTITAPANAVEVIIQADDTNTENLRFKIGGTATTTSGIQLQPGRSETLKVGANISIIPEAGTQKYNVQYITQ